MMNKAMYSPCAIVFTFLLLTSETRGDPPGHSLPLGSHMVPLDIDSLTEFPNPPDFYEKYMSKSKPFVVRSVLNIKTFPAVEKWNDDYFRKEFGDNMIQAETAKKEVRKLPPEDMTLRNFLDVYRRRELYMVQGYDDFPEETMDKIKNDIRVPRSLMCGGLQHSVESIIMWFSSGGTKSVLHSDDYENFNCVLDGTKELVFIDKKHKGEVEEIGWNEDGSFSDVDVDKVDMYRFTKLGDTTTHKVTLTGGDCLYIPYQWYHQVNSPGGRSLAMNFWFMPTGWFNHTDCKGKEFRQTEPTSPWIGLKNQDHVAWLQFTWTMQGSGTPDEFERTIHREFRALEHLQDEIFTVLDKDRSGSLSTAEFYDVDEAAMLEKFPGIRAAVSGENEEVAHDEL